MRARNAPSLKFIVMLGELLQVGGSVLNNAMSMHFQRQEAEKARLFNAEQAAIQRDWNEQMWNMNNAYNSPAAQMQRARDAGLNPSMLYGQPVAESQQASGGAEASVGIPSVPHLSNPFDGFALLSAQRDLLEAQADEVRSRIPLNQQRVNEIENRISDLQASVSERRARVELMLSQKGLTDEQRSNISFEQSLKSGYLDLEQRKFDLLSNKTQAEINRMNAEEKSLLARAAVSMRELQEMIWTYSVRKAGLEKQNLLTDAQINQANATADKLRKEGIRVDQIISQDENKTMTREAIRDAAQSSNPVEAIGASLLMSVDYCADKLLGSVLR